MTAETTATQGSSKGGESSDRRKRRIEEDDADSDEGEAEFNEPMQTDEDDAPSPGRKQRPVTPEKKPAPSSSKSQSGGGKEMLFSPELLRAYYSRLFPYDFLADWLSYDPPAPGQSKSGGNNKTSPRSLLPRREFSFTLEPSPGDEIYVRYQSFLTGSDLAAAVKRRCPTKIDIGAVFNHSPRDKNALGEGKFKTDQRELVFDVDLTDYDGVRNCGCSGAKICNRCWKMMTMAVRVMDVGLRDDFGFEHIAWFYSGRRGVHAWICDEGARTLSNEGRSAVASYFEVSMGTEKNKEGMILQYPLHPMLSRSYDILEPMFVRDVLPESGHGVLASREQWDALLDTLPDGARPVADRLRKKWNGRDGHESAPSDKWDELRRNLDILMGKANKGGGGGGKKAAKKLSSIDRIKIEQWPAKTVFKYCYPRLDINVSKMQNHLLKSPFCVHPKTGRVCVPLDVDTVDEFDPFDVPTLPQLMRELDEYEKTRGSRRTPSEEGDGGDGAATMEDAVSHEWQKTSLRGPFEKFQRQFLNPMWQELRREKRARAEEAAAATGDF